MIIHSRDVPCLAHMEQGPGPPTLSTYPLLICMELGTLSTSSSQQGWTWTVEWTFASSPTQNLWPSENVCQYCSLFPSSNTVFWSAYQMIICIVLIVAIFLGLINPRSATATYTSPITIIFLSTSNRQ